jgi:lipoprotein-anchoring transpeptidase ErfK/SrfK
LIIASRLLIIAALKHKQYVFMSLPVPILPSPSRSRRSPATPVGTALKAGRLLAFMPVVWLLALGGARGHAQGQAAPGSIVAAPSPSPTPGHGFFLFRAPQRTVAQVIPAQEGPNISARLMDRATPDNTNVIVSISKQRVYLMCENEVVIDSPISTGRKGHPTPTGSFHVREKQLAHFSNIYGNFLDRNERVVRSGVSERIDSAPSGTHFEGAPMKYFMRLTDEGVGMHIGVLPGYPASHGCIRLPALIAPMIYSKVRVGTSVLVED